MPIDIEWGQITIASLIAGLLGGVIGSWSSHVLAVWRDRARELNQTGKEFRDAFVDLQQLLSVRDPNHEGGDRYQKTVKLVKQNYENQHKALLRLEQYLSDSKREGLNKAWRSYCLFIGDPKTGPFLDLYQTSAMEEEQKIRDEVLVKIEEEMFKYTK